MEDLERRWPTLAEHIALARQGILDERHLRVRPSPEEIERMGAEADAYLAELAAREAANAKKGRPA